MEGKWHLRTHLLDWWTETSNAVFSWHAWLVGWKTRGVLHFRISWQTLPCLIQVDLTLTTSGRALYFLFKFSEKNVMWLWSFFWIFFLNIQITLGMKEVSHIGLMELRQALFQWCACFPLLLLHTSFIFLPTLHPPYPVGTLIPPPPPRLPHCLMSAYSFLTKCELHLGW